MFENRLLREIFGAKWDEVTGDWRKLHTEELNYLYCSPNIVSVIKSRRMRWVGNVACMGERRGAYRVFFLVRTPEERDHLGDPGVDGRIILTLRLLMSYIYGAPILDVSRSHTTTQHSR